MGRRERGAAVASVLAGVVLVVLEASMANVALPAMGRSLGATAGDTVWVTTAYQAALLMALLPCAALGESVGYRRVFRAGVAVFGAGAAMCAMAPGLGWLVAARFVQGLGGAAVLGLAVAQLQSVVGRERLGAAIGWNAVAVALGSAAGPAVGAAIVWGAGWRWLFAVNVPLGAAVLAGTRALADGEGTGRRLEGWNVVLSAGGFAALVGAAGVMGARPVEGVALVVAGVGAMAWLVRRERGQAAPLMPLDLLRGGSFRISVIASVCCFSGVAAAMVALPFYLQHGFGQGALETGVSMTAWPLAAAVAARLAGGLAKRVSTAWVCVAGGVLMAAALAGAGAWPREGGGAGLAGLTALCGLGFGFFQVSNNRSMFLAAPEGRSGAAGGMQGTARLAGQTAGAILMTVLFGLAPMEVAPRMGLWAAAVLTLGAGVVSVLRARAN